MCNYSDPFGLSPWGKIIKLGVRGFKTIMKNVDEDDLVRAVKEGEDVIAPSQQAASRIARRASHGARPVGPESNKIAGGQRGRPHYHVAGRANGSHIFYSAASALTLSHHARNSSPLVQKAAAVGDFFNPLSAPKDVLDVIDELKTP